MEFELGDVVDAKTGVKMTLESPLVVKIDKSPARFVYPLVYERDFPYFAEEHVIERSKYDCEDDFSGKSEPTCGWQLDAVSGEKVLHSQGFCCECDLINFSGVEATRGSSCDLIFNVGGAKSSAHCLRFSDPEADFKAFTMQAPILSYTIEVFI